MIRLTNDNLARLLHNQLYKRMLDFCNLYTPEMPGDMLVQMWLNRLFLGDDKLHILVNLDPEYYITEHAVIEITEQVGNRVVVCMQVQHDKPNAATFAEGIEYIDKLVQTTGANCSVIMTGKHTIAYQKKYGYHVARTVLIKTASDLTEENT